MPVAVSYPGVYIEELPPASPPAIAGVPTSLTSFLGRATIGPTDEPMTIFSFGDFTRLYGGLSPDYPLSYAVNDYFNNGGSEAIIGRLFEPSPGQGDGVAQLPFPPSPPPLPEGWQLQAKADVGASTISIQAPPESEGEPVLGMVFTLGGGKQQYLVTDYEVATAKAAATVTFLPSIAGTKGAVLPICTPLTFANGPSPSGWKVKEISKATLTLSDGQGVPQMGDHIVIDTIAGNYVVQAQPTVTPETNGYTVKMDLTEAPTGVSIIPGLAVDITPPTPSRPAVNWQIDAAHLDKAPYSLDLINGQNSPLPGDTFTVGENADVYIVTKYTTTGDGAGTVEFKLEPGASLPANTIEAFCFCCPLRFTRPPPEDWQVSKGPKAGETAMTLSNNGGAATGVVDVGVTFEVQGDPTIYTIVLYDPSSMQASFLPKAATAFGSSNAITLSPPLTLEAADPGSWGNGLTAKVDTDGITATSAKMFSEYGLGQEDLFNLSLSRVDTKGKVVASERYLNVAVKQTGEAAHYPNLLNRVLKSQSSLARVSVMSMTPPLSGSAVLGQGGNNGTYLSTETYLGNKETRTGMYILEHVQIFNLLCIPPDRRALPTIPLAMQDLDPTVRTEAASYCTDRRAIYVVDPPAAWANQVAQGKTSDIKLEDVGINGVNSAGEEIARNAAVYFPRLIQEDLAMKNQLEVFAPSGSIAGSIAANDVSRGVWSAPAGVQAGLSNVPKFEVNLTNDQNGILNPEAINCLRDFPTYGPVVWGARTMRGATQLEDEYMYLNVRRLTLYVESSLYNGTQWAVFQNNDEALWSSLRLSVNSFLADLAKQGAFYNYSVTCDASTTSVDDINNGIVNILVKIAPVKPAEFVVIEIQQVAPTTS